MPRAPTESANTSSPFQIVFYSAGRQLDDNLLLLISVHITNETQLRRLASQGLHLEGHVIDSAVNDEKRINLTAPLLLKIWRDGQRNSRVAFRKLYGIFERVQMPFIMNDVLEACNQ